MAVQRSLGEGKWLHVGECQLGIADWQWPLIGLCGEEIAGEWLRRTADAPGLFNGTVYLFKDYAVEENKLKGSLFQTDFKTLLYWRSQPFATRDSVREASGSSLIRSAEGHLLFGRQAPGQLNSGLIYPPSGVIDAADVVGNGIDIDASIRRELWEETGLTAGDFERVPGYVVALVGVHVTIGIEWRSSLTAIALRRRILDFLHAQKSPELEDIVIVDRHAPLAEELMPPHARVFTRALLA